MITNEGESFYAWNGKLFKSDIVRSAIRPKVRAIGKTIGKHIRKSIIDGAERIQVNPDAYMRFLLEEPNPYMTGQMLQEKMATQLELNHNAFAYIDRDENGYPVAIYPIIASACDALKDKQSQLYIKFILKKNGRAVTFRYTDIIHLRKDFNESEIFGDSPAEALTPLMEIVNTTDQGIVKAIKNSNVIRWLLKYSTPLKPEDLKKNAKEFVDSFLNTENSESVGAAAVDAKAEAKQIEPKDYVPNATQMDRTTKRILSFFNTNDKIVQSAYDEDEWISYYETTVEPDIIQMSYEFTRKLFSRRERGFGNKIIFESSNLNFASMQTKLNLVNYVDRGIMSPNEVRTILNLAPRDGGDEFIRRLDTRPTNE
jgi:HK97 family phage portal protein